MWAQCICPTGRMIGYGSLEMFNMITLPPGVTFYERGWLSSNNVLLQDEHQAVLVDSGYHSHASQTLSLVQAALAGKPLNRIINTHLHSDHCGGNAQLQLAYPSIQIDIPPGHASLVDAWDSNGLTYEPTGQHCPRFRKSGLVKNGDSFQVGNLTWHAHAAPGHDPHSIILFNEEMRILISADALWENGFGVVFPEIEGVGAFDEVEKTLNIIEALNPQLVLPGHGGAFSEIPQALARARSRLAQFRTSPEKHASYASKVLLKFKLLDFQSCDLSEFHNWTEKVSYLHLLHQQWQPRMNYRTWIQALLTELERAGACQLNENRITNV